MRGPRSWDPVNGVSPRLFLICLLESTLSKMTPLIIITNFNKFVKIFSQAEEDFIFVARLGPQLFAIPRRRSTEEGESLDFREK